ncbi:MAG: HAMP domain-containing histidine kinase [Acidobacteriia bacterium]|nr:HAMP domain-containing histidine kinase [Terriglobia bacterium]
MIDVCLVSQSTELHKLCSEVLEELFGQNVGFHAGTDHRSKSDVYIWDFQPNMVFPDDLDWRQKQKHFFLLQRRQMPAFRQKAPSPDLNLLLKPVTRATLKAFLANSLAASKDSAVGPQLHSMRADRDEILQCLIHTNLKLQEYDQERTNFLARAIHDFRAPLTALCGYSGLLLGEQLGTLTEDQKEVLQRMHYSAKRLSRMASAMFQLSVGQQVDTKPNFQKGDVRECIDQAVHELMPFADEKRISFSVELSPVEEPLFFERSQLEQVLINILDNACKFTPRQGLVEIQGYPFFWERRRQATGGPRQHDRRTTDSHAPNSFRVDIRDSGAGISPEHLNSIFEEYTSYSGGQDRSGGGLGLAICRLILSRHQGRIWAESSSAGAVFSFVLPFRLKDSPISVESNGFEKALYAGVV